MAYLSLKDTETSYGNYAVCEHNGYLISAGFGGDLFAGSIDANGNYSNIDSDSTYDILSLHSDGSRIYAGHWKTTPGISVWTFNGTTLSLLDFYSLPASMEVRSIVTGSGSDIFWTQFDTGTPNSGSINKGRWTAGNIVFDYAYGSLSGRPYSCIVDTGNSRVFVGEVFTAMKAFGIGASAFSLLGTLSARDKVEGLAFKNGNIYMADFGDGLYVYTFNGSSFSLVDSLTTSDYTDARSVVLDDYRDYIYLACHTGSLAGKINVARLIGSSLSHLDSLSDGAYKLAHSGLYTPPFVWTGDLNYGLRIYSIIQSVSPNSISSGEAFGSPTITGTAAITTLSILSAEAWGSPSLAVPPDDIEPIGIVSAEAFGTPSISTPVPTQSALPDPTPALTGDIRLVFDPYDQYVDFVLGDRDVQRDAGLETATFITLLTDKYADDGDPLPDDSGYRGGWYGDALPVVPDYRMGTKLWLLQRAKTVSEIPAIAKEYLLDGFQWMVEDGLVESVEVTVERRRDLLSTLAFTLSFKKPEGTTIFYNFYYNWEAQILRRR